MKTISLNVPKTLLEKSTFCWFCIIHNTLNNQKKNTKITKNKSSFWFKNKFYVFLFLFLVSALRSLTWFIILNRFFRHLDLMSRPDSRTLRKVSCEHSVLHILSFAISVQHVRFFKVRLYQPADCFVPLRSLAWYGSGVATSGFQQGRHKVQREQHESFRWRKDEQKTKMQRRWQWFMFSSCVCSPMSLSLRLQGVLDRTRALCALPQLHYW